MESLGQYQYVYLFHQTVDADIIKLDSSRDIQLGQFIRITASGHC